MGMKETHVLPENKEEVLVYMREKAYAEVDLSKHVDQLIFDPKVGGAYFVGKKADATKTEPTTSDLGGVAVIPIRKANGNEYQTDMLPERDFIPKELANVDFLLSIPYSPDEIYGWRAASWQDVKKKRADELTDEQKVLGEWLFPDVEQTKQTHPNLTMRIDGTWNGWDNTDGVDSKDEAYQKWGKDDKVEDAAFELYKSLVHPLKPMVKQSLK